MAWGDTRTDGPRPRRSPSTGLPLATLVHTLMPERPNSASHLGRVEPVVGERDDAVQRRRPPPACRPGPRPPAPPPPGCARATWPAISSIPRSTTGRARPGPGPGAGRRCARTARSGRRRGRARPGGGDRRWSRSGPGPEASGSRPTRRPRTARRSPAGPAGTCGPGRRPPAAPSWAMSIGSWPSDWLRSRANTASVADPANAGGPPRSSGVTVPTWVGTWVISTRRVAGSTTSASRAGSTMPSDPAGATAILHARARRAAAPARPSCSRRRTCRPPPGPGTPAGLRAMDQTMVDQAWVALSTTTTSSAGTPMTVPIASRASTSSSATCSAAS